MPDLGEFKPDNLFSGYTQPAVVGSEVITGGNFKRGTVLGLITSSEKMTIVDKTKNDGSQDVAAILAQDVDASQEDKTAAVYYTGEFNFNNLIFKDEDNSLNYKLSFRTAGIFGFQKEATKSMLPLYLIPQSGQSLSIGITDSSTIVTTGDLSGAYLFSGVPATSLTDTPITAQDTATYSAYSEVGRQTHGYSMISKLMESVDGEFVYASHGKGSSSVTDLSKESVMYSNGLEMIDKGSNIADDLGLDYKIPFVDFIQGESGFVNRTTDKNELRALHDDYIADVNAKTGQADLPMIIDQTGAYYSTENARARFEYTNENNDAYMACPKYMLNRLYNSSASDWVHLSPEGYVIQGEYHGLCAAAVMNGVNFKPLQPLSYQVVGNTIEITTNPVNGLSLDATTLPQCPAEGFVYNSAVGGEISPIVTISGDKLILDVGQPPRVGDVIDYGYSLDDSATHPSGEKLPCGNVRDNQGIVSTVGGFELNNWLVQFDYSIQRSDGVDTNIWIYGDPITTTGGAAGELIAGTNNDTNAGFEVGQTYQVTLKHNGTGGFRYRLCDDFLIMNGTGSEKQEAFTMDIGSVANLRNRMQYESDPFIGDIYDISVELQ